MYDEQEAKDQERAERIEAIVRCCVQLGREWAQEECRRRWDPSSGLSEMAYVAARAACVRDSADSVAVHKAAATAAERVAGTAAVDAKETAAVTHFVLPQDGRDEFRAAYEVASVVSAAHTRYARYVRGINPHTCWIDKAPEAYQSKRRLSHDALPSEAVSAGFDQAAADVVSGCAMGCAARGEPVEPCIRGVLAFVFGDEALDRVLEAVGRLKSRCDAWQRQRVCMVTCCGAIACVLGMVLPMLWGGVIPWACVLMGACVGGLLGYRHAWSRSSAKQVAWMLMGWAVMGLVAGGLSWVALSLVASHGAALAIGTSAAVLCTGIWACEGGEKTRRESIRGGLVAPVRGANGFLSPASHA